MRIRRLVLFVRTYRQARRLGFTLVDAFRTAHHLSTGGVGAPSGLVDQELVRALWAELEKAGKAAKVRELLLESTAVRR